MKRDRGRADAARVMTTVLSSQQRAGRFAREPDNIDAAAVDRGFETAGYVVDPHAVADAIVERLIAGRTLLVLEAPPGAGA
jgi:hypothetical protein